MPLIEKAPGIFEALDTRPFDDTGMEIAPPAPSPAPSERQGRSVTVREAVRSGTLDEAIDALWREAVLLLTDRDKRLSAGFLPDLDFPASQAAPKDASGKVREAVGFLTDPYFDSGLLAGTMDISGRPTTDSATTCPAVP